ncbi:TPA: tail fiber assembly protein [Enterobacter roggenkampii]|uniref:tail fiber assembly protein n=1 Tax=Enterobacter TaxID=547 RepID=UPI0024486362|nr:MULTISPECIES: tail fiber assembly protein [Enterobacter]MDG9870262.1 tail fiber assembly protein [Enterobacter roggenkampii]MDU7182009.1 tail fiber assembly protein [Enterobacter roggenkampii]MDU7509729.1 tail fiber assembly protein [Enterobacter sp.]MED5758320.1 tail fiber assembly protein [Enterobacter roggenkampii]
MTIKFSVNKQAFYDENTDVIPDDAVVITDEQHLSLISGMNDGGRRVYIGTDGELTLSDSKPSQWHTWDSETNEWVISADAQIKLADNEKSRLIQQANDYINSKQWPGKAAMGRLKDAEKVQYNAWLDYLDALEAVDTSTAPDIAWPTPPADNA